MGWDAYAVHPEFDPNLPEQTPFLTPELEEAFRRAGTSAWLDGLCMGLLHRATGIPDYDEGRDDLMWSRETVRKAQASAKWDIALQEWQEPQNLTWTRRLLDVCASQKLAIWFTW